MRFLPLALFVMLALPAWADDEKFEVEVDSSVYSPKSFAGKDRNVQAFEQEKKSPEAIPDQATREQAFEKVPGLAADLAKMDQLDRDMLYVRAKTRKLKALKKFYPQIEEKKLTLLQKAVGTGSQ